MKNLYLIILLIVCEFFAADMMAQKWVMVGRNVANLDGFSIVCTEAVTAADIVYITEEEYNNVTNQFAAISEGTAKYIPPAGGHTKGEVIWIRETGASSDVWEVVGCSSGTCGSVTTLNTSNIAIGGTDELYVYSDSDDDPTNGVTEIYSVWFWNGSEGMGEDPTGDFPDAEKLTIPGVIEHVDFKVGLRSSDVSSAIYVNIASSYDVQATGNVALSLTAFTSTFSLPVELVDFDAQQRQEIVLLKWTTASEIDNDFFSIERSKDGIEYESLGEVQGRGNTQLTTHYSFIDDNPIKGLNYYRLKQFDFDGKFYYSPVDVVNFNDDKVGDVLVNPNPFSEEIQIQLSNPFQRNTNFEVYDLMGRQVFSGIMKKDQLSKVINLSNFQPGVFILRFGNGENAITHRIVKL